MSYGWGKQAALTDFLPSMATLGTGAGLHLGVNLLARQALATRAGQRASNHMFSTGVRHGMNMQRLRAPVTQAVSSAVMPETLMTYEMGNALGSRLSEVPQRARDLKKLRKAIAISPNLREAPGGREMVAGLSEALSMQKNPTAPSKSIFVGPKLDTPKPTTPGGKLKSLLSHYALPATTTAAFGAVTPHAALHPAINTVRHAISTSKAGLDHVKRRAAVGAAVGVPKGPLAAASDLVLSPMALHGQRVSGALREEALSNPRNATRAATAFQKVLGVKIPHSEELSRASLILQPALAAAAQAKGK